MPTLSESQNDEVGERTKQLDLDGLEERIHKALGGGNDDQKEGGDIEEFEGGESDSANKG